MRCPRPAALPVRYPALATLAAMVLMAIELATAGPVAAALEVTPRTEAAEIGGYLVLDLALPLPAGVAVDPGSVAVTIDTGENEILGAAYPLRFAIPPDEDGFLRRQLAVEWAAPVEVRALPGRYPVAMELRYEDTTGEEVTAAWRGELALEFGPGWSGEVGARKVTHLIQSRGLPLFLLIVFGFGVLMSFTPCIYPMIPITLAVIGAQSQDKGVVRGFMLSLTYGLGLALVYAAIGAVAATVFSGITAYLQSPPILIPIALLMIVLSFGMFGAYELQAPAFLRNRLQGPGGNRAGIAGAFIMGMVAGLVASPCVGPFLSALLLWVGTTGSLFLGFWTLFVFGLGVSTLLVLVGTFPAAMGSLPQSGGWMETVKRAMGLLLVFMAFYFVRPGLVLPERIFYPLLGAVIIVASIFLGALDTMTATTHWWDRTRKGLGLIALVIGLYLFGGALLRYGFLPGMGDFVAHETAASAAVRSEEAAPAVANAATVREVPAVDTEAALPPKVPWEVVHTGENVRDFIDAKIAEATATGRPVVIDFWATWCKICQVLDKKVWNQPPVVEESLRFVTVKVDATENDDEMQAIWQEFRIVGLPTIIFVDSRGEVLHGKTVTGFLPPEQMLAHMRSIR